MSKLSTRYKKDYKNTTYRNLRVVKQEQNKKKKVLLIFLICVGIFILSLIYFFCFSSFFKVKNIKIIGLNDLSEGHVQGFIEKKIESRSLLVFSKKNLLFLDLEFLHKELNNEYLLEKLEIEKLLPQTLEVKIREKVSILNWVSNEKCYNLDIKGFVLGDCESDKALLMIKDLSNKNIEIGKQIVLPKKIEYIVNLDQKLGLVFPIIRYELPQVLTAEIRAITNKNLEILLNDTLRIEEQIKRLTILNQDKNFQEKLDTLSYIDLRFGEKVFYK